MLEKQFDTRDHEHPRNPWKAERPQGRKALKRRRRKLANLSRRKNR